MLHVNWFEIEENIFDDAWYTCVWRRKVSRIMLKKLSISLGIVVVALFTANCSGDIDIPDVKVTTEEVEVEDVSIPDGLIAYTVEDTAFKATFYYPQEWQSINLIEDTDYKAPTQDTESLVSMASADGETLVVNKSPQSSLASAQYAPHKGTVTDHQIDEDLGIETTFVDNQGIQQITTVSTKDEVSDTVVSLTLSVKENTSLTEEQLTYIAKSLYVETTS